MMMDATQKLAALKRWADAMELGSKHYSEMSKVLGLDPDGPTCTVFYELQNSLTLATAELVGDAENWLDWYWMENDMGRKGYPAGPVGATRPIETLDDLLWLIEAERAA